MTENKSNVVIEAMDVIRVLDDLKAPRGNLGYKYIIECMLLMNTSEYNNNEFLKITAMYRDVAKKCGTEYSRVERAIRHEIETIFANRDIDDVAYKIFGGYRDKRNKLGNKNFIISLYYYLTYYKDSQN